ncbi:MAG: hypothetical protein H0T60_08830 [Acidobacteria bacterium]|nr:hypothetical protein [Acidobacteriota bacterium]
MATAATKVTQGNTGISNEITAMTSGSNDVVESALVTVDESTKSATGVSLFHILTLASIGASLALFFAGKKSAAIFVGLWPPTFQALKSVADTNKDKNK